MARVLLRRQLERIMSNILVPVDYSDTPRAAVQAEKEQAGLESEVPVNQKSQKIRVLFVCRENICRSPLAEGLFRHHVKTAGLSKHFTIDSCGTSPHHAGSPPDSGARRVAASHDIRIKGLRSRQLEPSDFQYFDLIVCMDRSNVVGTRQLGNIRTSAGSEPDALGREQGELSPGIHLLRQWDPLAGLLRQQGRSIPPKRRDVPDPWRGRQAVFEAVYEIVDRSCQGLLEHLRLAVEG